MARGSKRLSDTAAVVAEPVGDSGSSHHISVRKIANGYLMSKSSSTNTGHSYEESFHPSAPRIVPPKVEAARGGSCGDECLAGAKDALK